MALFKSQLKDLVRTKKIELRGDGDYAPLTLSALTSLAIVLGPRLKLSKGLIVKYSNSDRFYMYKVIMKYPGGEETVGKVVIGPKAKIVEGLNYFEWKLSPVYRGSYSSELGHALERSYDHIKGFEHGILIVSQIRREYALELMRLSIGLKEPHLNPGELPLPNELLDTLLSPRIGEVVVTGKQYDYYGFIACDDLFCGSLAVMNAHIFVSQPKPEVIRLAKEEGGEEASSEAGKE